MVLDTVYFMKKLRPVLEDFCTDFEYALPPVDYLNGLKIQLTDCIPQTKAARSITGLYSPKERTVYLKERNSKEYVVTLVHELIHVIQHYNLGDTFLTVYNHQLHLFGYENSPLEKQAYTASNILNYFTLDLPKSLNRIIQTRLERRKPKKMQLDRDCYHYQDDLEPWYTKSNWKAIELSHKH